MSKSDNDWKKRLGTVYSSDPDYEYEYNNDHKEETPPPAEQDLRIKLEKKGRKGKTVSIVTGFRGKEEDLKELAATLKKKCGAGGNAKEGDIIIQGDFRNRLKDILSNEGFSVRII